MGMQELVSVIIPVYNVAPFLEEALDSAIYQTYENLEIIVIDDGSTDGSGKICDDYLCIDNRIRVVHQENRGLSAARNTGLDIMNGEVVAFLDSDDAYQQDYLAAMMKSMHYTNSDIVICKYVNIESESPEQLKRCGTETILPRVKQGLYNRLSILHVFADGMIDHSAWNKIYRRELWDNIRYPNGHVYEDISTTYKLFDKCQRVSVIDKPLYLRRIHSNSITNTLSVDFFWDEMTARSQFEAFIETNTPTIFTTNQVKRWKKSRLIRMINFYVEYSSKSEDQLMLRQLRNLIIGLGEKVNVDELWEQTKADYQNIINS